FLLHEGAVRICTRRCYMQSRKRKLVYVTRQGRIIPRNKWDPSLMKGVNIRTAFPFLCSRLTIDPGRCMRYSSLISTPTQRAAAPAAPATPVQAAFDPFGLNSGGDPVGSGPSGGSTGGGGKGGG